MIDSKEKSLLRSRIVEGLNALSKDMAIDIWTVEIPEKDRYSHIEPFCNYLCVKDDREISIKVIAFEGSPALVVESEENEAASILKLGKLEKSSKK